MQNNDSLRDEITYNSCLLEIAEERGNSKINWSLKGNKKKAKNYYKFEQLDEKYRNTTKKRKLNEMMMM